MLIDRIASLAYYLKKTPLRPILGRVYRLFRPTSETLVARNLKRIARMARNAIPGGTLEKGDRPRRIVINSHFVWNYGPVEYSLAAALRERGHEVTMIACGGLPDYCQLQNTTQERPPCDLCLARVVERFDAYGLPHVTMAANLQPDDIEHARRVAQETPTGDLKRVMEGNVNVGYLAFINLFQYFKGPAYEISPDVEAVFRRCLSSAILTTRASARIMRGLRADILITINGKFLHWAPFVDYARRNGIPFVTWEDFQIGPSTVMFASNEIAHEQRHGETWKMALSTPLDASQRDQVREHFSAWSTRGVTAWAGFGEETSEDTEQVRTLLGLSVHRPIISLFPNISWDSSSVGFETAFTSVFDWITKTIQYAAHRPDLDFVIRAHPAEARLPPEWRSVITTCDAVRKYGPPLPENVRLVESAAAVNSYSLAELSSVTMTYTSTLGIELPLRGIRPWVAGGPYYAGKGFTVDLQSAEEMIRLLDANQFPPRLTAEEIERAERLAYLIRFRGLFDFPFLSVPERLELSSWSELGPGGNEVMDELCKRILNARSLIDLPRRDLAKAHFWQFRRVA